MAMQITYLLSTLSVEDLKSKKIVKIQEDLTNSKWRNHMERVVLRNLQYNYISHGAENLPFHK